MDLKSKCHFNGNVIPRWGGGVKVCFYHNFFDQEILIGRLGNIILDYLSIDSIHIFCRIKKLKSRTTENLEVIGPKATCICLVSLDFRGFLFCGLWLFFFYSGLLFGFLSNLHGFRNSNLKLFSWTGLYRSMHQNSIFVFNSVRPATRLYL